MSLAKSKIKPDQRPYIEVEPIELGVVDEYSLEESVAILNIEVNKCSDAIEECNDVMFHLEELNETIEATLADGGMTVQTASVVNATLNCIGNSIGMEMALEPGLELFIGHDTTSASKEVGASALSATQSTASKIKDYIIKIWNAIKAFVVKWVDSITSFYGVWCRSYLVFLVKAVSLQKVLEHQSAFATDGKIKIPTQAYNNLLTSGSMKNCIIESERLTSRVLDLDKGGFVGNVVDRGLALFDKLVWEPGNGTVSHEAMLKNTYAKDLLKEVAGYKGNMEYTKIGDGTYTFTDKKPYIGELKATIEISLSDDDKSVSAKVTSVRDIPNNTAEEMEIEAYTQNEIIDALGACVYALQNLRDIRETTIKRFIAVKKATLQVDVLAHRMNKAPPEVQSTLEFKVAKKFIMDYSGITKLYAEPLLTYQKQLVATARALYTVCLKSLALRHDPDEKK